MVVSISRLDMYIMKGPSGNARKLMIDNNPPVFSFSFKDSIMVVLIRYKKKHNFFFTDWLLRGCDIIREGSCKIHRKPKIKEGDLVTVIVNMVLQHSFDNILWRYGVALECEPCCKVEKST